MVNFIIFNVVSSETVSNDRAYLDIVVFQQNPTPCTQL